MSVFDRLNPVHAVLQNFFFATTLLPEVKHAVKLFFVEDQITNLAKSPITTSDQLTLMSTTPL